MKKRNLILTMATIISVTLLSGCSKESNSTTANFANAPGTTTSTQTTTASANQTEITKDSDLTLPDDEEFSVSFDYKIDEATGMEYAVVSCKGSKGSFWSYETKKVDLGQVSQIEHLSSPEYKIYINEGGTITALNALDGSIAFTNSDYNSGGSVSTVDENGTLYICGYLSPDLLVIDKNGNTVKKIESFSDYFWPDRITLEDQKLTITFACEDDASVTIDTKDFSYVVNK